MSRKTVEVPPGQAAYVQKILVKEPRLQKLVLSSVTNVMLDKKMASFSPFSELVAAELIARGYNPYGVGKLAVMRVAMAILETPRKKTIRVVAPCLRNRKDQYAQYLRRRIGQQDDIVRRALKLKKKLIEKLADLET